MQVTHPKRMQKSSNPLYIQCLTNIQYSKCQKECLSVGRNVYSMQSEGVALKALFHATEVMIKLQD